MDAVYAVYLRLLVGWTQNELRFLKFRLISRIYRPKMVRGRIIVRP